MKNSGWEESGEYMGINNFMSTKDLCEIMNQEDPLFLTERSYLNPGMIYMDGNSLGLPTKRPKKSLIKSLEDWKRYGIDGRTEGRARQII
ncbi:hypothetical protein ACQKNS_06240 [Peribacillus sp. NPDC094092]|uniref:hypothetical protein n=1 Tax=Peribacillus sp. NPDC094092 TaxID=3390611 RepID=UPI003CFBEBEA